jgi:hypothetical protein
VKVRKNELVAAKRRVKLFITLDDGVTPAPAASSFAAVAASVALTGTHLATLTWAAATGIVGNGKTIALASDGSGAGSLTVTAGAYVFHFASGTTTMANFVTAAAGVFTFSGHTPADVLSAGDVQGPLTLAGGAEYGWEVSAGSSTFAPATGTVTNCTRAVGTGIDGCFQYEATQAEVNLTASEFTVKLEYPGFRTAIVTCEMNDAEDFASISEGSRTYGDSQRLHSSVLAGKVQNFGTGTLAFRSLDDAKTRLTVLTSALGRIASTIGDLLP